MKSGEDICTELLGVTVFKIIIKNGPAGPLRPQTRCFPGSLTRSQELEASLAKLTEDITDLTKAVSELDAAMAKETVFKSSGTSNV